MARLLRCRAVPGASATASSRQGERLVVSLRPPHPLGEHSHRDAAARLHGEGVLEEEDVVRPVAELVPRDRREGQERRRRRGHGALADPPAPSQAGEAPRNDDVEPDGRDVGVPIGHGLGAHLHEADDRHERAQEPEPAQGEPRRPLHGEESHGSCQEDQGRGADGLPPGQARRPGVDSRWPGRRARRSSRRTARRPRPRCRSGIPRPGRGSPSPRPATGPSPSPRSMRPKGRGAAASPGRAARGRAGGTEAAPDRRARASRPSAAAARRRAGAAGRGG